MAHRAQQSRTTRRRHAQRQTLAIHRTHRNRRQRRRTNRNHGTHQHLRHIHLHPLEHPSATQRHDTGHRHNQITKRTTNKHSARKRPIIGDVTTPRVQRDISPIAPFVRTAKLSQTRQESRRSPNSLSYTMVPASASLIVPASYAATASLTAFHILACLFQCLVFIHSILVFVYSSLSV